MSDLILVGNDSGGTIASFRLSGGPGGQRTLDRLAATEVGVGCGTFAVDGDVVYVAVRDPGPAVVTLRLDRSNGALAEVSRRATQDTLAYLAVADGALVGASYRGGWGQSWPVVDGVLGEPAGRVDHANMHASVVVGNHVYFVSLGDDLIAQFSILDGGQLEPLGEPVVRWSKGSGPRHLTASPDGTNVYLITEFSGEVVRFARDPRSGRLTPAESVLVHDPSAGLAHSRYGADPLEEHLIWCADVWTAGGGRWVLGTERTVSTVATVAVDEAGRLGDVVALTRTEEQPRGMAVSPDGSLVVVVGERSGHASLYEMGSDGSLALLDRAETGDGPNWVRFV